jgi:hypothetical protein
MLGGKQMDKKFKCPMMCGMQMMHGMEPMNMMPKMTMGEEMEMGKYYEDEEDDRQCVKMYSETSKKMMVYVKVEIDRMEEKDEMMHDERLDREMVRTMTDNAYNAMAREMPEMAEEEETRQYPRRRFARDLLGVLLLNELFRRRRRRRRRHYGDYPYGGYPYGGYDYDYYDYD